MLVPITVHVANNTTADPIEGVSISIWSTDFSTFFEEGTTDSSGDFITGLESDSYRVFLAKSGHTFYSLPKELSVGDTAVALDIVGTVATTPTIPEGLIWLYGTVKDLTLNPLPNIPIAISLTTSPQKKDLAVLDRSVMTVYSNESGQWGTLLPGGTTVTVTIIACKYMRSGLLPFAGSIEVGDLGIYG